MIRVKVKYIKHLTKFVFTFAKFQLVNLCYAIWQFHMFHISNVFERNWNQVNEEVEAEVEAEEEEEEGKTCAMYCTYI